MLKKTSAIVLRLLLLFTFVACVKRSDDVSPIEEAKSETTVSKTEVRGNIQETDKAAAIEVVDDTGCLTADQLMASSQFFSEYVLETSVKASDRKWLFHISNVVLKHDDEILCAVFQDHGGLANTERDHGFLLFALMEKQESGWKVSDVYSFDTVTYENLEMTRDFLYQIYEKEQKSVNYSGQIQKDFERAAIELLAASSVILSPDLYSNVEINELKEHFIASANSDPRRTFGDYVLGWSEYGTSFTDPAMIVTVQVAEEGLSEAVLQKAKSTFGENLLITLLVIHNEDWQMTVLH